MSSDDDDDRDELADLSNTRFVDQEPPTKEEIREQKRQQKQQERAEREARKEVLKEQRQREKEMRKLEKQSAPKQPSPAAAAEEGEDSVFSDKPTEIVGNEKRVLLAKITSYKQLFPTELKSFKVAKKATVQELQAAIDEMDSILNVSGVEQFMMDGCLASLRLVEGLSASSQNYNVTGMTDMLKNNKDFHSLSKRLFLKYGLFTSAPPEYQMLFLISTTAWLCKQKNQNRTSINAFLDTTI
jgi:hypothetical protein